MFQHGSSWRFGGLGSLLVCSSLLLLSSVGTVQAQEEPPVYLPLIIRLNPCLEQQLQEPSVAVDPACPPPASSSGVARGDFNGDGFADLAIGIPHEDISPSAGVELTNVGAVSIIFGSANGLVAANDQLWTQDSSGIEGEAEAYDFFGAALASGEFNGDMYADLAIGVPGEDVSNIADAGAVNVLYGGPGGLAAANNQVWNQGTSVSGTLLDSPEKGDYFGAALAWGDFNNDNIGDLAIGVRNESIVTGSGPAINSAGAVSVIYGSNNRLSAAGNQIWTQNNPGVASSSEEGDLFGYALTGGNFNGDDYRDLAIGIPREDLTTSGGVAVGNAGAVTILYGSATGLSATAGPGNQIVSQGTAGIQENAEPADNFGMVLAAADFNRDGRSDLAVGVPFEDLGGIQNAGAVNIIYGSANGLTNADDELFTQDSSGSDGSVDDVAETNDRFGSALGAGDFDGDGFRDLAIGIPYEDNRVYLGLYYFDFVDAGGVNLLHGYGGGLTTDNANFIHELDFHHSTYPGFMRSYNRFGASLTVWNFGKGSEADLVIGVPGDERNAGAVDIFYGPVNENSTTQSWNQDSPGIEGEAEPGDEFGSAVY